MTPASVTNEQVVEYLSTCSREDLKWIMHTLEERLGLSLAVFGGAPLFKVGPFHFFMRPEPA